VAFTTISRFELHPGGLQIEREDRRCQARSHGEVWRPVEEPSAEPGQHRVPDGDSSHGMAPVLDAAWANRLPMTRS
jgi:hypothetical protein